MIVAGSEEEGEGEEEVESEKGGEGEEDVEVEVERLAELDLIKCEGLMNMDVIMWE